MIVEWAFGLVIKMHASRIGARVCCKALLLTPHAAQTWQAVMTPQSWIPTSAWKAWLELPAPGFGPPSQSSCGYLGAVSQ